MKTRKLRRLEREIGDLIAFISDAEDSLVRCVDRQLLCQDPKRAKPALALLSERLDGLIGDFDLKTRCALLFGHRGEVLAELRKTLTAADALLKDAVSAISKLNRNQNQGVTRCE